MKNFIVEFSEYIVGIPAAILSLLLAWLIYTKQKSIKKITYRILGQYSLLRTNLQNEEIKLLYRDKTYTDINVLIVRIKNEGNKSIVKNDFDSNIKIEFENIKLEILNVEIISKEPEEIDVKHSTINNYVDISPLLLNPKEHFDIKIVTNSHSIFKLSSRINGVNKIELDTKEKIGHALVMKFVASGLIVAISSFFAGFYDSTTSSNYGVYLAIVTFIFTILIFALDQLKTGKRH